MPLFHFFSDGRNRLGKLFGEELVDLSVAAPNLPDSVIDFLNAGEAALQAFRAVNGQSAARISPAEVRLLQPVPSTEQFLGIGMNYRDHASEAANAGIEMPPYQLWFNNQVSSITGPLDEEIKPNVSEKEDYEAELGVVIGWRCRQVAAEDARSIIGGYLAANDVSAHDWQLRSPSYTLGKSFDTHGPIGPRLIGLEA